MISLVVMTDGRRDCLVRSVASMDRLHGPISVRLIHDDAGDPHYTHWLWDTFGPQGFVVHSTGTRSGFGGAVRSAWDWLRQHDRNPYIWWSEDDFVYLRDVDLTAMIDTLDEHPNLVQMALLRQPWNDEEKRAGGIVEMHPEDYVEHTHNGHSWRQHRRHFTTNPHMLPRRIVTDFDWPEGGNSEGVFGQGLLADRRLACAYWGDNCSGVWVEHIGTDRAGTGY